MHIMLCPHRCPHICPHRCPHDSNHAMHHATLSHMLCHAHTDVLFMYHHTNAMPVVQMLRPNRKSRSGGSGKMLMGVAAMHGSRSLSYAPAPAPARMSISGSQVERLPVSLQVWNASLRVLHLQSSAPSCPCPGPCPGPWVQVPRHLLVACLPAPTRASW